MPLYKYRAKNQDDNISEGLVEAETEAIAIRILEEKNLTVYFIEQKKRSLADINILLNSVKPKDLVIFSRQLSVLISAEVRLVEALTDIAEQIENPRFKKIISDVATDVEGGVKFSEALAAYPKVFSNYFINIIRSGEASGRLQEVLNYLADQMERDYDLQSKVKGAMIYPAFIISALILIGVLMMIFVVPQLTSMLTETGAELPFSTRLLIGTSNFFINFWWLLLIAFIGVIILLRFLYNTKTGKKNFDRALLRMPVFGSLFRYINVVRFSNGFRTLLIGGVDIIESLNIAASMMDNQVYKDIIKETTAVVEEGGSISENFEKSKYVPKMVGQMIRTGEDTGKMELVLEKVGGFYTREIDNLLKNLMSLLEPVIMVVLGVAVAGMVAAIVLPMYEVSMNMG